MIPAIIFWLNGWGVVLTPYRAFAAGPATRVFAASALVRVFVAPPPR